MLAQAFTQILHDLLDRGSKRAGENKQIFRAFAGRRKDDQIFGKKFRLMRDHRAVEIDRLRKWPSVLARDKMEFARLFVRGDKRAEQIRPECGARGR